MRDYEAVKLSLEEARDNLEAMIWDCKESAKDEEDRILDDAREAGYYAEELEKLLRENTLSEESRKVLKFAVSWLYTIVNRKGEVR